MTVVPRTCSVRQELAAWGRAEPALPLVLEKPGRTKDAPPRCWQGQRVIRQGAVEDSDGRVMAETLRFVGGHASQRAQQQAAQKGPKRELQPLAGIDQELQRAMPEPVGIHAPAETLQVVPHLILIVFC